MRKYFFPFYIAKIAYAFRVWNNIILNVLYIFRLTLQGNLKYETESAPNNGYYFIPLYDKGEYILKVNNY